jgi:hypothetical protein
VQIRSHGQITRIEELVEIGTQEKPVRHEMGARIGVGLDVGGLQDRERMVARYSAGSLFPAPLGPTK